MSDDIRIVALSLQILGIYFLALSTIFKKPRRVVEEVIGSPRGSLRPVKDYLYRMNQLVIGLILLISGYGLQILGVLDSGRAEVTHGSYLFSGWSRVAVMVFLAACISVVGVVLHFVGSLLAKRSFKNLIISYVKEHNWAFEDNMKLTKEIGNIIGVSEATVSTIEEYVDEVKRRLKLLND
jgi:hypothetical protein